MSRSPDTPAPTPRSWPRWLSGWLDVFAVDVRSLAALRIVLALTVLADLAMRAPNLRVHYSDDGILPRPVLLASLDPWLVSVALSNGTPLFQGLLFVAAAVAAVGMFLGYRTRLMTAIVWVLMFSIHWRNPFVGYSADGLLRLLLFWPLFVPLGAVWSLDRQRGRTPGSPSARVLSLGTAGLLLQIAFMYWTTVLLKSGREWRVDGTAISSALSIQELATPLGTALLQFPELLKVLTFFTLGIEIVAPLLLFSPVWTAPLRMAGIAAIVALQTGIWLTLAVGIFPWLAASCMVCFLPSWFWDTLLPRWRMGLVRLGAAAAIRHPAERLARPIGDRLGSWPGIRGNVRLALAATSPATAGPVAGVLATNPAIPNPEPPPGSWASPAPRTRAIGSPSLLNLAAGFFLVYVVVWNLTSVSAVTLTHDARALGSLLGLVQSWTMFTPYPVDSTTWYAIPGTLRDGRQIDLLPVLFHGDAHRLTPASDEKPLDMSAAFARDERWRKYFENLHDANNAHLLGLLADYLCREWNAAHEGTPAQLETLQIIYHWERTLPGNQRAPVQRAMQWGGECVVDPSGS